MELKTPKGTRDYAPNEAQALSRLVRKAERAYKKRGALPMYTPVFELRDVLMNKYGEQERLVYDLAEQGGEVCALRYDLTVPLARFVAQKGIVKMKRYQTGPVFRRDQPALAKGRYREFVQSDFDIVGDYEHMTADAEVVSAACEILRAVSEETRRPCVLRINHKKLVSAMMQACGVSEMLEKSVGSSLDKLDKVSWEEVSIELRSKGVSSEAIDALAECVHACPLLPRGLMWVENLEVQRERIRQIFATEKGKEAVADIKTLNEMLIIQGVTDSELQLDLLLVRGLDYYTGVLLEGGCADGGGSILAGGRYDTLVSSLKKEKSVTKNIPCVGVSFGVTRSLMLYPEPEPARGACVCVCSVGPDLLLERMRMCAYLRKHGIASEYFMGATSNFHRHSEYAESRGALVIVLVGRKEIEKKEFHLIWGPKQERMKKTVQEAQLVAEIKEILSLHAAPGAGA